MTAHSNRALHKISHNIAGFFSQAFDGGLKIFGPPSGTDEDKIGWRGACDKNLTEAKTAHLMQN